MERTENKPKYEITAVNAEGMFGAKGFLPITPEELDGSPDFVMITPEAYVDHPSFGHALIARLFESLGFSVAILYNPRSDDEYKRFGTPNHGFLISGGAVDSMVNNYTVAKRRRDKDVYTPGGKLERPDRAVSYYCKNLKRLFPDTPVIIGGVEASLRRLAHYDYWADKVLPSLLESSGADLLIYGMGEKPVADIAERLHRGIPLGKIKDVRGTAYLSAFESLPSWIKNAVENRDFSQIELLPSFDEVSADKKSYAQTYRRQEKNNDFYTGKTLLQKQGCGKYAVVNRPQLPLSEKELDRVYALPFTREVHPYYESLGKVASIDEVKFSIATHRGCYGSCSFCAITFHQGRIIQTRSKQSIVDEAVKLTEMSDFKGYIHDVGGPTANFYRSACEKQLNCGVCSDKNCIGWKPCPNLKVDHSEYLDLLRTLRTLPKIKKVFVRSGIRFDYLLYDEDRTFFKELVKYHISGQLKVAPEHIDDTALYYMNKPPFKVYEKFVDEYKRLNIGAGKDQYLVPYLISSHPGCDLNSAINLALYLKSLNYMPKQVQDFYPTPSTRATTMYYSGYDPMDMTPVYTAKSEAEKAMQRALLQYRLPENRDRIVEALTITGRTELIPHLVGINLPSVRSVQGKGKASGYQKNCRQTKSDKAVSTGKPNAGTTSQNSKTKKDNRSATQGKKGSANADKCVKTAKTVSSSINKNNINKTKTSPDKADKGAKSTQLSKGDKHNALRKK